MKSKPQHISLLPRSLRAWPVVLLLLGALPVRAEPTAVAVLQQMKEAAGGPSWNKVESVAAQGDKISFGLVGKFHSVESLRSGHFRRDADFGFFANAEGLDDSGRWRMDNSRQIHPLDSDEANAVAITEAYLTRRGYLFPESVPATFEMLSGQVENGRDFDCVQATPTGGRSVVLWVGRKDHLLDRALLQLSTTTETIRYGDYRRVDGLELPFQLETSNGDESETGKATIASYQLAARSSDAALVRPSNAVADAAIRGGRPSTTAHFALDEANGFPLVWASVNGKGPLPFILDTGGHDILTPAAAARLGLKPVGNGFSLGAGSGSTPTQFTAVERLMVGDAEIKSSPFVVLQVDLGHVAGTDGKREPIAGIIGLELFERFAVTLDYCAHTLTLRPFAAIASRPGGTAIPIRFTSDMPLVHASLNGKPGWFGIDTGNNIDVILVGRWVIGNGLLHALGLNGSLQGSSLGGSLDLRKGQARDLTIGALRIADPKVVVAGDNMGDLSSRFEAGNIGESILSKYRVTFDYRHERMTLE